VQHAPQRDSPRYRSDASPVSRPPFVSSTSAPPEEGVRHEIASLSCCNWGCRGNCHRLVSRSRPATPRPIGAGALARSTTALAATAGTWGKAEEIPGAATLNAGGDAKVNSLACVSSGSCAAGGYYSDASGTEQTFVAGYTPGPVIAKPAVVGIASTPDGTGYWTADSAGAVKGFGDAPAYPALASTGVEVSDIVGIAPDPVATGFWLVGRDGSIYPFGGAASHGSLPGQGVKASDIVGIAPTADGKGYWLVGADGGEFAFGDARYNGSLPGIGVHVHDIAGMVASPRSRGYLMLGTDGGVFAFGAEFHGSLPGLRVKVSDIVGILPTKNEAGYVLVGADGGAFVLGTGSGFYGSLPGRGIHVENVTGLALTPDDHGYWMVGAGGTVYAFGDAKIYS
jgi:hypothetical protein